MGAAARAADDRARRTRTAARKSGRTRSRSSTSRRNTPRRSGRMSTGSPTRLVEVIGAALADLRPARLTVRRTTAPFAHNRRGAAAVGSRRAGAGSDRRRRPTPGGRLRLCVPQHDDAAGRRPLLRRLRRVRRRPTWRRTTRRRSRCSSPAPGPTRTPSPRGTIDLARRHGQTLAEAVATVPDATRDWTRSPARCASPSRKCRSTSNRSPSRDDPGGGRGPPTTRRRAPRPSTCWPASTGARPSPRRYPCPLQVARFGDGLLLIALGGEPVVDYAHELKRRHAAPGRVVWVAGYANDMFGYVPDGRASSARADTRATGPSSGAPCRPPSRRTPSSGSWTASIGWWNDSNRTDATMSRTRPPEDPPDLRRHGRVRGRRDARRRGPRGLPASSGTCSRSRARSARDVFRGRGLPPPRRGRPAPAGEPLPVAAAGRGAPVPRRAPRRSPTRRSRSARSASSTTAAWSSAARRACPPIARSSPACPATGSTTGPSSATRAARRGGKDRRCCGSSANRDDQPHGHAVRQRTRYLSTFASSSSTPSPGRSGATALPAAERQRRP